MSKGNGEGGSAYPKSVQAGIPKLSNPAGWPVVRIGDIFKVVQRPVDLQDDAEYQLVTAKRNRGGVVPRERLTGKAILTKSQFRIAAGDFLISRRQIAHGACGIVPTELAGAIVSNEYATLLPTDQLYPGFMRHLPESIYFQQTCFHSSIGVHVEKLVFNLEEWLQWPIAVPDIEEQRRISNALAVWDSAINYAKTLSAKKYYTQLSIARKFFRGIEGTLTLSDLVQINAKSLDSKTKDSLEFEYFPISDDDEAAGWMSFGSSPSRARRLADPGDVVYSTVRPMLRRLFIAPKHPSAVYSTGYAVLHPNAPEDSAFIYAVMVSEFVERQVFGRLTGSGYPAISASDLRELKIPGVSPENRRKFGGLMKSLSDERLGIEAICESVRRQKRGLMQKLLTGEWQVPDTIDRLMPGGDAAVALAREASAA